MNKNNKLSASKTETADVQINIPFPMGTCLVNIQEYVMIKNENIELNAKYREMTRQKDEFKEMAFRQTETIEHIITTYSNGKIIRMNEEEEIEPEAEMVKDVLQIMNVFVAKMNGRRKYNKHNIE